MLPWRILKVVITRAAMLFILELATAAAAITALLRLIGSIRNSSIR